MNNLMPLLLFMGMNKKSDMFSSEDRLFETIEALGKLSGDNRMSGVLRTMKSLKGLGALTGDGGLMNILSTLGGGTSENGNPSGLLSSLGNIKNLAPLLSVLGKSGDLSGLLGTLGKNGNLSDIVSSLGKSGDLSGLLSALGKNGNLSDVISTLSKSGDLSGILSMLGKEEKNTTDPICNQNAISINDSFPSAEVRYTDRFQELVNRVGSCRKRFI